MKTNVFLVASLLLALFSCTSKQEQKEVPVRSLKHELLMGVGIIRNIRIRLSGAILSVCTTGMET